MANTPTMSREAELIANELLRHQKQIKKQALVTYKELCKRAGVPFNRNTVGHFLFEIAGWCDKKGLPPINALAVNKQTGRPGHGFAGAPGSSDARWPQDIGRCLTSKYPSSVR
jgi:hypothetical protein